MSDRVERASAQRAFLMMLLASLFLVWQIPAMDMFAAMAERDKRWMDILMLIGGLAWSGALIALLVTGRRGRKQTLVDAALEDELVQANRAKAFQIGYGAMLTAAAGLFALALFLPVSGRDVAQIIIAVGVAVPLYTFAYLERRFA